MIFPFLAIHSISSSLRLIFLVVRGGCRGSQSCVLPCICSLQGNLFSRAVCILPVRLIEPGFVSLSQPWTNNNLQGNACTDCLSNQYCRVLDLGDGVSFYWKIRLWEEVWMNTFWFSFLVLKEGKRLECVCVWRGELGRRMCTVISIHHSRYSLKSFPC